MQKFSGRVEISTESRPIETPEMCSDVFQLIVHATRLSSWCPNIYKICLDSSGIGPDGAEVMAAALSQCIGLAELSLRENGLGDRGAEMLSGNGSGGGLGTALVHLDLANNRIADAGICSISMALAKQNIRLKYLNLSENAFGLNGAKCLAGNLSVDNLETLSLGLKDTYHHDHHDNAEFARHLGTGLLPACSSLKRLSIPGRSVCAPSAN
jgi:Ran GTPase-activating protein (RanGAP) involved in mRNA processing and transport